MSELGAIVGDKMTLLYYVTRTVYLAFRRYVVEQHGQIEGALTSRPEAEWAKLFAEWSGLYCGHLGGDAQSVEQAVDKVVAELLECSEPSGWGDVVQVTDETLKEALMQLVSPIRSVSAQQLNEIKHAAKHIVATVDALQEAGNDS